MKRNMPQGGFTLLEVMVGLAVFLGVALPMIRFLVMLTVATTVKDRRNAYAILHGECAVMYKNQKLPEPVRSVSIDNRVYEISCIADKESTLVNWTMSVKKSGKPVGAVHGLLYVPDAPAKELP